MFARVALDPNVLLEDPGHDRAIMRAAHRELARMLMQHGVVIQEDQGKLFRLIERMPQHLKSMWKNAYERIYREVAPAPLPLSIGEIETEADLDMHWGTKAQVAIVERLRAIYLGVLDDDAYHNTAGGVEVVRFDIVRDSPTFRMLESLSSSQVPPNAQRNHVWRDRLHLLALNAEFVTICDRYAGKELVDTRNDSGLYWLLRKLDGCRKTKIHILTGAGSYYDISRVKETLEGLATDFRQGGIREIKLTLAPDKVFMRHAHDRHIRFDHHVFNLSKGVFVFAKERADQGYLISRFDYESAVRTEKLIRDNASLSEHVVATKSRPIDPAPTTVYGHTSSVTST